MWDSYERSTWEWNIVDEIEGRSDWLIPVADNHLKSATQFTCGVDCINTRFYYVTTDEIIDNKETWFGYILFVTLVSDNHRSRCCLVAVWI